MMERRKPIIYGQILMPCCFALSICNGAKRIVAETASPERIPSQSLSMAFARPNAAPENINADGIYNTPKIACLTAFFVIFKFNEDLNLAELIGLVLKKVIRTRIITTESV